MDAICHKLEQTGPEEGQVRSSFVVDWPTSDEISTLCLLGSNTIPGIAGNDVVRRVVNHNRDSLLGIFRNSREPGVPRRALGFYANLMLNGAGHAAVKTGLLDPSDPQEEFMAPTGVRPSAIYSWAVVAPGLLDKTLPLLAVKLTALYADLPILTAAATTAGKKAIARKGFTTDAAGIGTYEQSSHVATSFARGTA